MPIYRYGERVPSVHESVFVAPNASVLGSVVLSENVSVWFGATIRGDNDVITLGKGSNVQDGAVLHTDPGIKLTVGGMSPSGIRRCFTAVRLATALSSAFKRSCSTAR